MTSEPQEELISAYLDGELSPDERAQVEALLASNAELRQLHDELRAVKNDLQALPRHQLDHDLGPAVLRRAERTVLAGEQAGSDTNGAHPIAGRVAEAAAGWRSRRNWRRVAWPVAACAAALLLTVLERVQRPVDREVAQAPQRGEAPETTELQDKPAAAGQNYSFEAPKGERTLDTAAPASPSAPADAAPAQVASPAARMEQPPQAGLRIAPNKSLSSGAVQSAAGKLELAKDAAPALKLVSADEQVEIEVTDEFLRAQAFEKMLKKRNIAWQRADTDSVDALELNRQDYQKLKKTVAAVAVPREDYVVEATEDQVDELVTELRNDPKQVKQVAGNRGLVNRSKLARDLKQQAQRRVVFTLQTPVPVPAAETDGNKP